MELAKEVQRVRRSSLTFAPEAGTQRLRDVINKGVKDEDLIEATGAAFREGWKAVKLYFMIGLPTETDEDLDGIVRLARAVLTLGRKAACPGAAEGTISASSVPKAHTAFQWEPQTPGRTAEKTGLPVREVKRKRYCLNYHDAGLSFWRLLARGTGDWGGLARAVDLGCRFDGWSEHFQLDRWLKLSLDRTDPEDYANRRYVQRSRPGAIETGVSGSTLSGSISGP